MRHRLAFQTRAESRDAFGQDTGSWSTQFTRWGSIEAVSGGERFQAQQAQANMTHNMVVTYDSETVTVDPTWRVSFDSRIFEIVATFDPGEMHKTIELQTRERTDGGG